MAKLYIELTQVICCETGEVKFFKSKDDAEQFVVDEDYQWWIDE